jgi:hypothetical protein
MSSAENLPHSEEERLDANSMPYGPGGSQDDVLDGDDLIGIGGDEVREHSEPNGSSQ